MDLLDAIAHESRVGFSEFDEETTWTPQGGAATPLRGHFDRNSDVQDIGQMIEMDGLAAMLNYATVDAPGMARGDTIEARGVTYRVVSHQPDGTGRTVVMLGI